MTPTSDDDLTPPMGVANDAHAAIGRGIATIEHMLSVYTEERREQDAKFYGTRMVPLEDRVARLGAVAWFAVGVGCSALMVGLAGLVVALRALG